MGFDPDGLKGELKDIVNPGEPDPVVGPEVPETGEFDPGEPDGFEPDGFEPDEVGAPDPELGAPDGELGFDPLPERGDPAKFTGTFVGTETWVEELVPVGAKTIA